MLCFPKFIQMFKINKMCKQSFLYSFPRLLPLEPGSLIPTGRDFIFLLLITNTGVQGLGLQSPPIQLSALLRLCLLSLISHPGLTGTRWNSGPLSEVKNCTRHLGVGVKLGRRVGTSVGSAIEWKFSVLIDSVFTEDNIHNLFLTHKRLFHDSRCALTYSVTADKIWSPIPTSWTSMILEISCVNTAV